MYLQCCYRTLTKALLAAWLLSSQLKYLLTYNFLIVRLSRIYSLSNIQLDNTSLLIIIHMLYRRFSEFIHFAKVRLSIVIFDGHLPTLAYSNHCSPRQVWLFQISQRKEIVCYLFFLCMVFFNQHNALKFIHIATNYSISFFKKKEQYSIVLIHLSVYVCHSLHSSGKGSELISCLGYYE